MKTRLGAGRVLATGALALLLQVPGVAFAGGGPENSTGDTEEYHSAGVNTEFNRTHLNADIGYSPPLLDMDNLDGGGLSLGIGAQHVLSNDLGLGLRGRYAHLLLSTEAALTVYFIDLQVVVGYHVFDALFPYLALGTTIVGNAMSGTTRHDAHFGTALGVTYTYWLGAGGGNRLGIEAGAEIDAMFDGGFEHTGTRSGTAVDMMFAHFLVFTGIRYSFGWESHDGS